MPGRPSFLVLGAPRAGTTSLHYYLEQHPEIAMSTVKEPGHFLFRPAPGGPEPLVDDARIIRKSVADPAAYAELFDVQPRHRAVGEISPLYLYTRETPALIAERLSGVRAVAVLREPVARAWSHFLYVDGSHWRGQAARFEELVRAEAAAGPRYTPYRAGTHFLRLGLYAEQLRRYLDVLGPHRLHVMWFDELEREPDRVLAALCGFLGVDDRFRFDTAIRYNRAGVNGSLLAAARSAMARAQPHLKARLPRPAVRMLARTRARVQGRLGRVPPELAEEAPELVADLREWFQPAQQALCDLLSRPAIDWQR